MKNEFFFALGKLTYTFAFTEKLIKDLYCTIDDRHISEINNESLSSLIKSIKVIAKARNYITKDTYKILEISLDGIINVSKQRNEIMHNFWSLGVDIYSQEHIDFIHETIENNGNLDFELDKVFYGKETTIENINEVTNKINQATLKLFKFMKYHLDNVVKIKKF